jgi:hypothetical protein
MHPAHIPTVKTTRYGLNSFRYYASKTWNELPDHFMKETSFNQFKRTGIGCIRFNGLKIKQATFADILVQFF